ncbi:MAG: leucine-rich repeat protein [Clostridia bacterium]|nr:leucine-rich repeat protein [Clostridia bacterium]
MRFLVSLLLCLCFVLPSCAEFDRVQVTLYTGDHFVADTSIQWVLPGEDVSFSLQVDSGYAVTGADYDGPYRITRSSAKTMLTLFSVPYPTHVQLTVSPNARTITYDPNGGHGEAFSVDVSVTGRRPNTDQGKGFARNGYTLTGWNTSPDGTGQRIGLGSRVSVPGEGLVLYAVWEKWAPEDAFTWETDVEGARITGYTGTYDPLVIPASLGGQPVLSIAENAFSRCTAKTVVFPDTPISVEKDAFQEAELQTLVLFDNVLSLPDSAFSGCSDLTTLFINAATDPYGMRWRRESVYADKIDLLLLSEGQRRLIFYGGCSTWYNLDTAAIRTAFGDRYAIVNLGLNGTVSSYVQMEILLSLLSPGDTVVHTPEIASRKQLLTSLVMDEGDEKLWCGLEYNYDLFSLVPLTPLSGVFDSWQRYRNRKEPGGTYADTYRDSSGRSYMDEIGGVPLIRTQSRPGLTDAVSLDTTLLSAGLPRLCEMYERMAEKGARVLVSSTCINMDAVPEEERENLDAMDALFHEALKPSPARVISHLQPYVVRDTDCYDTNYHLLSQAAYANTLLWIKDLQEVLQ